MKHPKRLFLFAGYNKDEIFDTALIYYVSTLSKYGDVILCMDNNIKKTAPLEKYTIKIIDIHHGEYDFGSYKRAFQYAFDNNLLQDYDNIYLVNDSVFGPLFDINPTLEKLEHLNTDAASLIISKHKTHEFMESWFIKLNKKIFNSKWFADFINSVKKQPTKAQITIKYEHGLSNIISKNGCSYGGIYVCHGRFTYNHPKKLFTHGCPFIKKACFTRHNGAIGKQLKYILNNCQMNTQLPIITTANQLYGQKYMDWLLTSNPIKIIIRKLKYIIQKTTHGRI